MTERIQYADSMQWIEKQQILKIYDRQAWPQSFSVILVLYFSRVKSLLVG